MRLAGSGMFSWWHKWRAAPPLPEALWQSVLANFPFIAQRPARELAQLRDLASGFLRQKEFHGAQGLVITDEMALSIAVQAVLPVQHLGLDWYDDFVGIVVHPDEVVAHRTRTDETGVVHAYDEVLAGEAMERGPVMLSWRDVREASSPLHEGYNVVIHEFAHKLDMRDGEPDGCPPLPTRAARQAWRDVMTREYDAFREKVIRAERFSGEPPWLDPYGAQAIDEFFAVACEAYFVSPTRFAAEFPALKPLLDGFFRPAAKP